MIAVTSAGMITILFTLVSLLSFRIGSRVSLELLSLSHKSAGCTIVMDVAACFTCRSRSGGSVYNIFTIRAPPIPNCKANTDLSTP